MRTPFLFSLFAALFLCAAPALFANDDGRWGFSDHASWRLGEPVRGGYAIYRQIGRGWFRVPGAGIAIADGWVLGTRRESGGYAIYRWNGRGWDQAPGGAVRIGGSYQRPWVVNNRGQRFVWDGFDWRPDFAGGGHGDRGRGFDRQREHGRDGFRFRQRERFWREPRWQPEDRRYRRGGRW